MKIQCPDFLKEGDTIAIVGLAKKVNKKDIDFAIDIFRKKGLKVKIANHLYKDHFRYSAPDELRLIDFQHALDDPDVKVIIAARGGYGNARIIDQVDWSGFKKSPKWLVGFSDITASLGKIFQLGYASIHGIMPAFFHQRGANISIEALLKLLFGEKEMFSSPYHPYNVAGEVSAPLIGGNLSILCSMIGTSSDFDYGDKILFLEDIDEYLYRIDRMLMQLKRSGKLASLKGVILGQFSNMKDNEGDAFGKSIDEILAEYFQNMGIPVAFNFPAGHEPINYPLIIGKTYTLSVSEHGALLNPD